MKLNDPNILKVDHVCVSDEDDHLSGIVITVDQSCEILLSEDELKKLLRWCKTGEVPQ